MINQRYALVTILCCLLLFAGTACKEQPDEMETPLPEETAVSEAIDPTPEPTATTAPEETAVPTAEPTPLVPMIAVDAQEITDEGMITIASVLTSAPGWVVIYAQADGEMGEILGYASVEAGLTTDLVMTVDPLLATPDMVAMLHVDEGEAGSFEYPDGPDEPIEYQSGMIATPFTAEFQLSLPVITIANQEVLDDGWITVESVQAFQDGWLVIHADEDGELGPYLGSVPVEAGLNQDLQVHIPWRQGSDTLYAVIYNDNGRSQRLDIPGEDTPFLANGQPIIEAFTVTYPPDLFVLDQPVLDGSFVVERVYSDGPGWLVVYFDNEGEPGLIIGYEPLEPGVNENVEVTVLETAVTNPLYLRLHEDTEPGDGFDFPRVDPPVVYQDRQLLPVSFNTSPGDYLFTADQTLLSTDAETVTVTVPLAVVSAPAWVVIHNDNEGVRGDILGWIQVTPGINRNLVIEVDPSALTETIYAGLYADLGEEGTFEPDGEDVAFQRNRRFLESSFVVTSPPDEN